MNDRVPDNHMTPDNNSPTHRTSELYSAFLSNLMEDRDRIRGHSRTSSTVATVFGARQSRRAEPYRTCATIIRHRTTTGRPRQARPGQATSIQRADGMMHPPPPAGKGAPAAATAAHTHTSVDDRTHGGSARRRGGAATLVLICARILSGSDSGCGVRRVQNRATGQLVFGTGRCKPARAQVMFRARLRRPSQAAE